MGPREVTLEAAWLSGGRTVVKTGGTYSWERVFPEGEDLDVAKK